MGDSLLKVPSPVSLLWVLTMSWSYSPPGSDSAQGSDVSLTVLKVRPWVSRLEGALGQRGHTGWRGLWVGHVSMSGLWRISALT